MDVNNYLSNFYKGTKNPNLNTMKYFMEEFGHPEKDLKFIHIAGTNGKGSTTQMMTNILSKAGYKVGKFTSPHLVNYNERISIGNTNITDAEMEKLIVKIDEKIQKYDEKVTLFEIETTMALLYFQEKKCDFVILETGLGGLYDCTNIVHPLVSIITSIGYDHMDILGNTLLEIAEQKAGIIKENSDTVLIEQTDEINDLMRKIAKEKNNTLHFVNKTDITNYSYNQELQTFDYKDLKDLQIRLKGKKQIENASICVECAEILNRKFCDVSEVAIREGLKETLHKGRFEIIYKNPLMIYDGAHNQPAIENFIDTVKMYYPNSHKIYIISILKTKDYKAILKELLKDKEASFIFTSGNDDKEYVSKEELLKTAKQYTVSGNLYTKELKEAIDFVKETKKNSVTFIIGSFYIYGTVIQNLKEY